jgi:hypothetical protein
MRDALKLIRSEPTSSWLDESLAPEDGVLSFEEGILYLLSFALVIIKKLFQL